MDAAELLAAKQLREETVTVNLDGGGSTAQLRIRALPRRAYRELLESHPSEKDGEDWDPESFPPALIAASVVDPDLSLDDAQQIWDEWEAAEAGPLFLACWAINERRAGDRLGFTWPGSAQTSGSGQNSTTASRGESRTRSSSTGRKTTKTKP